MEEVEFKELVGKTFTLVTDCHKGSEEIDFETEKEWYRLGTTYDCCASICVESFDGDVEDLIDTPILEATCEFSELSKREYETDDNYKKLYWCFYKLRTKKGYVTIRWVESNNGYYSVDVEFKKTLKN
jgi:hypothetical protein